MLGEVDEHCATQFSKRTPSADSASSVGEVGRGLP